MGRDAQEVVRRTLRMAAGVGCGRLGVFGLVEWKDAVFGEASEEEWSASTSSPSLS